ncbi:hypothetical protein BVC80_687g1 [Macleaya cordata]|uniref:Endonuclease/exonuclease/phosphatase n=1 Tax=Macleaya cordata TaxID=56857 RepID=A0A200Q2Y7_MACCD|nr:hypothetical protein BVC80_687g1 [Macleaya cordata]
MAKPKPLSDHTPILLRNEGVLSGPRPFRFELMWLENEALPTLIAEWWTEKTFKGNLGYIF